MSKLFLFVDPKGVPILCPTAAGSRVATWERGMNWKRVNGEWIEAGEAFDENGMPLWHCDFLGFGYKGEPQKVRLICSSREKPDDLTVFDVFGGSDTR